MLLCTLVAHDIWSFGFVEHNDDVITSPYNSILSSQQLIEHADCVFPLDNNALQAFNLLERNQR
jgi:hypothetical protein